jgi:hypothetical protein
VESLVEDFELSVCRRHPSLFSLLFDLVCPFCFVVHVLFRSSVYHSSLGEHSLTLCLTCSVPLVL